MKKIMLTISICMALTLCACNNTAKPTEKETNSYASVDTADAASPGTDIVPDTEKSEAADTSSTDISESEVPHAVQFGEQNAKTEQLPSAETGLPKESSPHAETSKKDESSAPTETSKPAEASIPIETSKPIEASTPTETSQQPQEVSFDINYWIDFAQNYAASVGLRLERSATACWDNPISVGEHCINMERDIKGRLELYSRTSDITDVWIWAEKRADNSYDLFIGYA